MRRLRSDIEVPLASVRMAVAAEIQDRLAPYPPASEANDPSRPRWYERGFGTRWRGGRGGNKTSQMMNRQWDLRAISTTAVLRNMATYSAYVHHDPADGGPHQAWFHGPRGWRTDKQVIAQVISDGTVQEITVIALEGYLQGE